jgi:hypothetical protein
MTALALPPRSLSLATQLLLALILVPVIGGVLLGLWPHASAWSRHQVPLGFVAPSADISGAAGIYMHNLRVLATPLLGAAFLCWLRFNGRSTRGARVLLDVFLTFSVTANGGLLTLSVAGYGLSRMAQWLPHLPFEFAAIALAISTYSLARRVPLRPLQLVASLVACAALLAVAALLETYAIPHR